MNGGGGATAPAGNNHSKVHSKNAIVAGGSTASKHNNSTEDKQKSSIVFTSSSSSVGDNETTLDQLMGQIHLNGLRKRNWDRNNSRATPTSAKNDYYRNDGTSTVPYPYWSRGIGDLNVVPSWTWSSGEDSSSAACRLVAEPSTTKPPPKGDAKDITYWTDLFFNNNAQTDHSNGATSARKTSAASIVIGNNKLVQPDLAIGGGGGGHSEVKPTPYLYVDAGYTDPRYLLTDNGKRKQNLSKTKISTNLNGESERLNKANDLLGMSSTGNSNGMSDSSNEDSRFIQVGA